MATLKDYGLMTQKDYRKEFEKSSICFKTFLKILSETVEKLEQEVDLNTFFESYNCNLTINDSQNEDEVFIKKLFSLMFRILRESHDEDSDKRKLYTKLHKMITKNRDKCSYENLKNYIHNNNNIKFLKKRKKTNK